MTDNKNIDYRRRILTMDEVAGPYDISAVEQMKELAAEIAGVKKKDLPQFSADNPEKDFINTIVISDAEKTRKEARGKDGGGKEVLH